MRRCSRCGQPFVVVSRDQFRCLPCHRYVTTQIAADAKRRAPRFPFGKDYSGRTAA